MCGAPASALRASLDPLPYRITSLSLDLNHTFGRAAAADFRAAGCCADSLKENELPLLLSPPP